MQDFDDNWDAIAFIEQEHVEAGYAEGKKDARVKSFAEGYSMGAKRALAFGLEIGFYTRFARDTLERTDISSRARNLLVIIQRLCDQFPRENQPDVDMSELLNTICAKFRLSCALLGISSQGASAASTSF